MKKWTIIVSVLVCCCLYALVKLSKPQGQNEFDQSENPQFEVQADVGDTSKAPSIENSSSVVSRTQVEDVGNTDKDPMTENSGPAVPADQIEAVTKAFKEFQGCLKDGKYEQAWELTSEHFKNVAVHGGFEGIKEACDQMGMATVTLHPESAVETEDGVGFLISGSSMEKDIYIFH